MRSILLILFLFTTSLSFAQQADVSGRCTDKRGVFLDGVKVYSKDANPSIVFTNEKGIYQLQFDSIGVFVIEYRMPGSDLTEKRTIELFDKSSINLPDLKFKFQQEEGGVIIAEKLDPFVLPILPPVDLGLLPLGVATRLLIYTTAATSNNELTSNYNVRGGSYDENLVYVNGFKIYRPFLTRSGQQEGMSFIHSSLVESIGFSAGGFNAEYGDKLSSVLDIDYKTPDSMNGSAMVSLLGVESHFAAAPSTRFNYIIGARYRSNGY